MKNLSVGKKLFVGFGLVILLMLVILAVTVVTSLDRNKQLDEINTITDMQTVAGNLSDNVNGGWVNLRTVFTSTNYTTEYDEAVSELNAAQVDLEEMQVLADKLPPASAEIYSAANQTMRDEFAALMPTLENIRSTDKDVNASLENLMASADTMATASTNMVDVINALVLENLADVDGSQERIEKLQIPVQKFSESIDALRIASSDVILLQEADTAPELHSMMDQIEAELAAIVPQLQTDANKAAAEEISQAISQYRQALDTVLGHIEKTDGYVADARAQLDNLLSTVTAGVDAIATQTNDTLELNIQTSNSVMLMLVGVVVVAILIAVAIAVYLSRAITRPLGMMKTVLAQVGDTGNMDFDEELIGNLKKEGEAKDEIGQSITAFTKMMDRLLYISANLAQIANRDLTADIALLTPQDTMGIALRDMSDNLNEMFSEINSVSGQVATASHEIAQGAQSLAQGSTEQASTVEEVSASINEINEQMTASSETSSAAAKQGNEISDIAQEGSNKMGQMMQAMQEISDASSAIGNVIKVIDDIAFQTNILALNAAVEAARAGEHGKGFAVVADEVRNLAGKSADAAKETSVLISANIEKTELGLNISQDTATSLNQIIEGIHSTSESLQHLAEQSETSKAATTQVNLAIDQVAQVVQQNSATSEESAAASEEMSSQAQVLQQLIARFKLKEMDGGASTSAKRLPAAPADDFGMDAVTTGSGDVIF